MEKKTDLRILKTHMALHNAFTELLEKRPFEDLTVNELCNAAMIRRTTFYKYFSDKYDYFHFYLSEIMEESKMAAPLDMFYDSPLEYTEKRVYYYLEFIRQHQKLVNNLKNSSMVSFLYRSIQKQYEGELRYILSSAKNYTASPELDFTISLYTGALISAIGWCLEHPSTFSDKEIARLLLNNLAYPKYLNDLKDNA